MKEAPDYANSHVIIPKNEKKKKKKNKKKKNIINHARKAWLFTKKQTGIKKQRGLFDVITSAHDRTEVNKLVGSSLLYVLIIQT